MADIFVSYARADKARVAPLVAALERQGLSVWWDPEITPGQEFDRQISAELDAAKAVIVVWTPSSVDSRWVRGEAREAADRGILVPVRFDNARLPIDARAMHTTDLDDWKEDADSRAFKDLARALSALLRSSRAGDAVAASAQSAQSQASGLSICVLPFANMSGDSEQEYFSDGISEDIITDLSKVSALTVISRNSAFTFKGKHVDLPQVARQLKVSHVLEGSVRKSGNRVRITAQLIDGATNGHVWAERYDRDLSDIFALQDEISEAIVTALKLKLFPEEKKAIEDRGTTNLESYDRYLRAQALANQGSPEDSERAEALFREALAIDPNFSRARAGLCLIYSYRLIFFPRQNTQTIEAMDGTVQEALALAPDHWGSHVANGILLALRRDWLGAEAAYEKAKLAPAADLTFRSMYLGAVGRAAESTRELERARGADPLSLTASHQLQQALYVEGRIAEAQAEYERALRLRGNREPTEHAALMWIWDSGDMVRIKAQYRRFLDSQALPFAVLNRALEVIDRPDAALALIRDAFGDPASQDSTRMMLLSWYAARFGDPALAVAAMRRSYIDLSGPYVRAMWYPFLHEARMTAAFKQLVRDLGLYGYWRASGKWGDFARPLGDDDFEIVR